MQKTIRDVAKQANVSCSTVSRVISNNKKISEETRNRVYKAIEEVGYVLNKNASGLAGSKSKTLGILVPDIENPFYIELLKAVENHSSILGYSLFICITNEDSIKEEKYLYEMMQRRVDGIILTSTIIGDEKVIEKMGDYSKIVSIQADVENVVRIDVDNYNSTYKLIDGFIKNGIRKIGFLGYKFEQLNLLHRLKGYKQALINNSIDIESSLIIEGDALENPGYDMTKKLLEQNKNVELIHCMNEYIAFGCYEYLREKKILIPSQIMVSAFDGLKSSQILYPSITTVVQPIKRMGTEAVELIDRLINKKSSHESKVIEFETKIKEGNSTNKIWKGSKYAK